ncbi:zinc finger BED domain-containing protein RICESLEEPER 2-like [Rhizophagus clarus]|uniref:Zinc finger BED domain-containing protein RICESLEEPER 2-like n=1 Tax=Rhizophagus clarus TaxID=94130 RepID=A0A8H3LGT9_9GLOM|nr:zinc finger BED domain-containing protein RICESLEEPER 2-like [Rhizophagus clarus]
MEEIEKELLSEETVISDDDEYNLEYFNNREYINFNNQEWDYDINPNESISQIFQGSETSSLVGASTVWLYFDKNPPSAPGFNVCKRCSFKYKSTTSVTTLRRHLEKHQINVPTKKYTKVVENKNQDPFEKNQQEEHDNCLIQWLICDLQPFIIVENYYFKKFINFFCPRYTIPNRHKVKDLITDSFNIQRNQIKNELCKIVGRFSLTADMWSCSINQESFLSLTLHYINSDWKLCNFLLDIIPFNISHTGINISNEIMRVLQEFNISNRIIALTTDNESAMVVCGREIASSFDNEFSMMTFSHYRCAGHVLNLGVKQGLKLVDAAVIKVRKLSKTIKKSTRINNALKQFCELKKIHHLKPILDIEIRWNSTYYMLKRFVELEPALNLLAADDELIKSLCPINSEWTAIKDTISLLEPLEKATRYLSGISYPTMREVRLVYIGIQSHLKRFEENDNNTQREVAKVISSKIDKNSITSAILDPRNKLEIFTDETNARQHIQTIYKIYKERANSSNASFTDQKQHSPKSARQYFLQLQKETSQTPANEVTPNAESEKTELDYYLAILNDEEADPLLW